MAISSSYHHGDLKPALLAYALKQMERGKLEKLSMREMAKALGVSHTAAYRHFNNKAGLLDAVATEGFERILKQCTLAVEKTQKDAGSRLKACGLAYVQFGLKSPRLLSHMFNSVSLSSASPSLQETGARFFNLLLELIIAGQEQKAFRAGDARSLAHACWAMVHGLSVLLSLGVAQPTQTQRNAPLIDAELAIDTFLKGLDEA